MTLKRWATSPSLHLVASFLGLRDLRLPAPAGNWRQLPALLRDGPVGVILVERQERFVVLRARWLEPTLPARGRPRLGGCTARAGGATAANATETLPWLLAQPPGQPTAAKRASRGGPGHWIQLMKPLEEWLWALGPNLANGVALLATPAPLDLDMSGVCDGAGIALRGAGTIAADPSDAGGSAVRPGLTRQVAMEQELGPSRSSAGCCPLTTMFVPMFDDLQRIQS